MDIFLGLLLGLIIGGGGGWITASSKAKSSLEQTIRDLEGKARGAESGRDAVQRQAAIFQQEIANLNSQLEKFHNVRIQLVGEIKASETKKESIQENFENLQKVLSNLEKDFQKMQGENTELQLSIGIANNENINLQKNISSFSDQIEILKREKNTEIESLKQQHQQIIDGLKEQMVDTFKALAADALKQGSEEFQVKAEEDLARRQKSIEGIVKPVQENLSKLEHEIRELEKARTGSYGELKAQVDSLIQAEKELRQETGHLVNALKQPIGRGQWGEVILEKVLEISGMIENVHYMKQISTNTDDGRIRPDIVVTLPSGRNIVIDAKAVMGAYLNTILNSHDNIEREKGHRDHVNQLKNRINDLSKKEYSSQFQPSPEFIILFLPAESLFSFALQFDKNLLEYAASKNVILATPTTLIALLRTIHYGWKQDEIAKNAKEIGEIGSELYDRLAKMIDHFNNVGKCIEKTSKAFDTTANSFNTRLRPSFDKLRMKAAKGQNEITEIEQLNVSSKSFSELEPKSNLT